MSKKIRRKQILAAARCVFLKEGYGASNIDIIAQKAGISKPTVYKHFDSKIALFSAMIETMTDNLTIDSEDILEICKKLPPHKGLTFLAERLVETIYKPEIIQLYRLVISENNKFPEMSEALALCSCNHCHDHCAILLETYVDKGLAKIDNIEVACNQFLLLLEEPILYMLVMRRDALPDLQEQTQIIERTVNLFWAYYAA